MHINPGPANNSTDYKTNSDQIVVTETNKITIKWERSLKHPGGIQNLARNRNG